MMKRNKWLVLLSIVLAVSFVLSSGGLPAKAQTAVELRVAWWGSQVRHDATIKVIEMFQQKNPNIKITFEFASFNEYRTKLTTQAAGSNLPDVMQMDYAWLTEWQSKNLLLPLDDFVKDST